MAMKPGCLGKSSTQLAVVVCMAVCSSAATRASGAVATIELVTLAAAGPDDSVAILPTSEGALEPGSTFFVEVWAQTTNSNGLSSVSIDITYSTSLASAVSITHTSLFFELQHGVIDDANGLVDDLSGSHLGACSDQVAVAPNWGRVAIIEMTADAEGFLTIRSSETSSIVYGTAICSVGDVDPANITYGAANVTIGDPSIPAVCAWGLIVMSLLVLTVGTLAFTRRRPPAGAEEDIGLG